MSESPGSLIGLSNIVTRTRCRVAPGPDPEATPGLRDRLHTHALRSLEGSESFIHDAIIHGRRVRLFSNSYHLADFWRDTWLTEAEWLSVTGRAVAREPALTVYAMINVPTVVEASYVSRERKEVYLFNTSYYGDLRACSMEALGGILGPEARLLHAGAVQANGRGLLLLYPKEVIHPTPVWGLMELPGTRFLADGWVAADPGGRLHAIEKNLYVRASFVESFPEHAAKLLMSKFENVPDPTPALVDTAMPRAQSVYEAALRHDPRHSLRALPPDRARELLLRLLASPDSRALADPAAIFGKSRLTRGPLQTAAVFSLRAAGGEPLRRVRIEPFACDGYEVNVSAVPGHPRELARLIAGQ